MVLPSSVARTTPEKYTAAPMSRDILRPLTTFASSTGSAAIVVIQSIADNEQVRNREAHIIRFHIAHAANCLLEQHARLNLVGFELPQLLRDTMQCLPCIQDVVDQQDVTSPNIQAQFLRED